MDTGESLFDWDEGNLKHLALHGITPEEAEQVIRTRPITLGVSTRDGELRRQELGQTIAGRILLIVTTIRRGKIRVVTGWPAGRDVRAVWLELTQVRNQEPPKDKP